MTIIELARMNDAEARTYFEKLRWTNGPECPHCKSHNVTRMEGKKHRVGAFQCNDGNCRQQFTVTVGTVLERSKVSIVNWIMAFHLICSSKKGFSALQLQRELGLGSYKTAWFMLHRIRLAMQEGQLHEPQLSGIVEVDETYVGGKPRPGSGPAQRGRGTDKTPVMVLVERDGTARSMPVERVDHQTLCGEVHRHVEQSSTIMTDEWRSYNGLGAVYGGGHHTTNHRSRQYSRYDADRDMHVNTNTAESFFSLVKRGHYGVYHQMSKKHLHLYCTEFEFRWNRRKCSDHARMEDAIKGISGKRLYYETPANA